MKAFNWIGIHLPFTLALIVMYIIQLLPNKRIGAAVILIKGRFMNFVKFLISIYDWLCISI